MSNPIEFLFFKIAGCFRTTVSEKEYIRFLQKAFLKCFSHAKYVSYRDSSYLFDLPLISAILDKWGMLPNGPPIDFTDESESQDTLEEFEDWLREVKGRALVSKQGLLAGTGRWLDFADRTQHGTSGAFVSEVLEQLLRNIEVSRKSCLTPIIPNRHESANMIERSNVSIFLARYSLRHSDFRALNSAMKLNDWSFGKYRNASASLELAKYILAVAEQENCIRELFQQ